MEIASQALKLKDYCLSVGDIRDLEKLGLLLASWLDITFLN